MMMWPGPHLMPGATMGSPAADNTGYTPYRLLTVDGATLPPRVDQHVQRFTRRVSRGERLTRVFAIFQEGQRSPAFEVVGDFPSRATAKDNLGTAICAARFRAGLGIRYVELKWGDQVLAQASGGLFWGTTGSIDGDNFKLEGSTKYGNWVVKTNDGRVIMSMNGDGAIQVEPTYDPVVAVLLAICCEELDGKEMRFFIW